MDVFNTRKVDEELIREYFERNERKKSDEAWLKSKAPIIREALKDTPRSIFGDLVVVLSTPNTSKFNNDKVMEFLEERVKPLNEEIYELCVKDAVDEKGLADCLEQGLLSIEELKEYAWEESTGTTRLSISKRRTKDD